MEPVSFKRHRFPADIIHHAVWLYCRFTLSLRDVNGLLAERGIEVSYETIRCPLDDESENSRVSKSEASAQRFLSTHAAVYNMVCT